MKKAYFKQADLDFIRNSFPSTFNELKKFLNPDGVSVDYPTDEIREELVTTLEEAQLSDKSLNGIEPNKIGLRIEAIIDSVNLVDY